jgi:hypothetical protein
LIFALLFSLFSSKAQYLQLGAHNFGSANTLSAVPNSSSIYSNPAAMAFFNKSLISVSYFKTLPVEGFNTLGLYGQLVKNNWAFGASIDSFGDQIYKESSGGVGIARQQDKVSFGLKFSVFNHKIEEISSRQTLLGQFGIMIKPHKFFNAGLQLINFTRARLYGIDPLPTMLLIGLALNLSQNVVLSPQVDYPLGHKPQLRIGLNYKIKPNLQFSTGINPSQKNVHFGVGYRQSSYGFNYGVATASNLGLSHQFSLDYYFGK